MEGISAIGIDAAAGSCMGGFDFDGSHCEAAQKDKQHKREEQTPFHGLNLVSLQEEECRYFDVDVQDELCLWL